MDKIKISLAVVSIILAGCTVAAVTASSTTSSTPLHTVRMEQASSKMNFLPTAVNEFTYTTEKGYNLDHEVTGYLNSVKPFATYNSCEPDTCDLTCPVTCWYTCSATCEETCPNTCDTCWNTCWYTCHTCKICPPTEGPAC